MFSKIPFGTIGYLGILGAVSVFLYQCQRASEVEQTTTAIHQSPPVFKALPADSVVHLSARIKKYEEYLQNQLLRTHTPGAALVLLENGKIALAKGYGLRSSESRELVDTATVFRIGSLSKGFAAVLTGLMVQKGQLCLNDPVSKWLPDFKTRTPADIRVDHLLSHTGGFCYHAFSAAVDEGRSMSTLLAEGFPKLKLSDQPGTRYAYQNAAFSLIQPILEQATGKSYSELLEEYIFEPAKMHRSSCTREALDADSNVAYPQAASAYGNWSDEPISSTYYGDFVAAGGINASIMDMGRWLEFLLRQNDPNALAEATKNQIFSPRIPTGGERHILPGWISRQNAHYAMGWRVLVAGQDTIMYHSGYVNGYRSEIAFDCRNKRGLCLLVNAKTDLSDDCIRLFFEEK